MTKRELIDYCLTYPDAYEDYPFDESWAVLRHSGNHKSFAFIYERNNRVCVNLKCEPVRGDFLRRTFADVIPAYHMNKEHWNTVWLGGSLPEQELYDMIDHSHGLTKPKTKAGKGAAEQNHITVRACKLDDYQRIYEINRDAFGYEYPMEKTRERLAAILQRPTDRLWVACVGDRVVGYLHGSDYECTYSGSLKNIMAIAVEETARGMGIGRLLLQALEGWAADCGCEGVRLVSGENRTKAHAFYLHCGYTLRKQQKNFVKIIPEADL